MGQLESLLKGKTLDIYALRRGDRCEAQEFMDDLAASATERFESLMRAMVSIADNGYGVNRNVWKRLRPNLFEIRKPGVRLFCFVHPESHRMVVITGGLCKGPKHEQTRAIERAVRMRDEYIASLVAHQ